jgi:hypothetical protein
VVRFWFVSGSHPAEQTRIPLYCGPRGTRTLNLRSGSRGFDAGIFGRFYWGVRVVDSPKSLWQTAFHVTSHVTRAATGEPWDTQAPGVRCGLILGLESTSRDSKSADCSFLQRRLAGAPQFRPFCVVEAGQARCSCRYVRTPGRLQARCRCCVYSGSSVSVSTWRGRTTPKCRRSKVATSDSPRRSQAAITVASVVPSGRL